LGLSHIEANCVDPALPLKQRRWRQACAGKPPSSLRDAPGLWADREVHGGIARRVVEPMAGRIRFDIHDTASISRSS